MNRHTPGPWIIKKEIELGCIYGPTSTVICCASMPDARLIAKAPEMHVQLQIVEEFLNSRPPHIYFPPNLRTGIRALLREIEGEK